MTRKSKKKNPTIFVLEGTIKHYDDGSMLQLHSLITIKEWELIIEETVRYKVFLECLKSVGCPLLGEPWDDEDDWFRLQLDIAVARMRNIDALLVAKYNQKELTGAFEEKMRKNAAEVQALVEQMRAEKRAAIRGRFDNEMGGDDDTVIVSDL